MSRWPQISSRGPAAALLALAVLSALAYGGWRILGLTTSGSETPLAVRAPATPPPTPTFAPSPTSPPAPVSWADAAQNWAVIASDLALTPTPPPAPDGAPPADASSQPSNEPPSFAPPPPPTTSSEPPPPVANNAPPPPAQSSGVDAAYTAAVLSRINSERASRGLSTVSINGALQSAADSYSALLTQLHTLSHNANGLDLLTRLTTAGYGGSVMGEILWYGGGIFAPDETVDAWLASPGHHDIMLDPHFTLAGASCYIYVAGSDYETRCVVDFGG